MEHDLGDRLARSLADQIGMEVHVERLLPLAGGASRESWQVDLRIESGPEAGAYSLVLRRDQHSKIQPDALDRSSEFLLIAQAHSDGVQVPKPRWSGELDRPYFLMDRVEGESIGTRIVGLPELAAARESLPVQMGEQLARIHRIHTDLQFLPAPGPGETTASWSTRKLRHHADQIGIRNPAYQLAFRWLEANAPRPRELTLVHGDYRIGNVIVGPEGLRAIVDWEFAHLGDPAEDLAWPCVRFWRFGEDALSFGGIGSREAFLVSYAEAGGPEVDMRAVEYWEIMGNLRWAVGCQSQANRHLSGEDRSVELASLGRRAAEMELEFLRLIEQAEQNG
jgi:aminoglycoside phosphotransferase (APT) family kinase protein